MGSITVGTSPGKVALVTGGALGIGAALCRRLSIEGYAVAVFDRDADAAKDTAAAITAGGGVASVHVGDVAREADVRGAVASCLEQHGRLDAAAGIAGVLRHSLVPDCDESLWDEVLNTNLKGCFLLGKHAVPALRRSGGGSIAFAASVMADAATPGSAAYSASKAGIAALTRSMALDHAAENIRVNCVAPGSVRTPMLLAAAAAAADPNAEVESWGTGHPIGRIIEPEEVAELLCFLLSPRASAITGSAHRVDGGLMARLPI